MPAPSQPICAFDIETRGDIPQFVCGSIVSDATVEYFDDAHTMIQALRVHARKRYILVAHNAEYEIANLLWAYGEDVSCMYVEDRFISAAWHYGPQKRTAPIWCSWRLAAGMSLEALGKAIDMPKHAMPFKLADPDDPRKDWLCAAHDMVGCVECYCVRDSEIVWGYMNAMREWLHGNDLKLKRSLASMSMDMWKMWDPNQQQTIRSRDLKLLSRKAYHGARSEVYRYGAAVSINTYDMRMFYGSILADIELPDLSQLQMNTGGKGCVIPDEGTGVADVTVECPSMYCPPLPCISSDRQYYPVGTFRTAVPLSELRDAIGAGCSVRRTHAVAWSPTVTRPFQTTAGVLIALREEWRSKGDPREIIAKHLLNAITGRLGLSDSPTFRTYRRWNARMSRDQMQGADLENSGRALYLLKTIPVTRPSSTANVLWAACITGEGRRRLYQHLREAGKSLLYCDTDSVHSLSTLYAPHDAPGALRDTGRYDKGLYLGPKFYRLEAYDGSGEVRAKGIPRRYADTFISNGKVEFQTTMNIVEAISRGIEPGSWVDVERVSRYVPAGRTLTNLLAINRHDMQSDTLPHVFDIGESDMNVMAKE